MNPLSIKKVENIVRGLMSDSNEWSVNYIFKNKTIKAKIISENISVILTFNKKGMLIKEEPCIFHSI